MKTDLVDSKDCTQYLINMTDIRSASPLFWLAAAVVAFLLYLGYLALNRLYLSPIAGFPGPKLAAVTWWYEFYYDVSCGGQYCFKINELHDQYGTLSYFAAVR